MTEWLRPDKMAVEDTAGTPLDAVRPEGPTRGVAVVARVGSFSTDAIRSTLKLMNRWRWAVVASAALGGCVAAAPSAWSTTTHRPQGVVENCASQSGGTFTNVYDSADNLIEGPLVMIGAAGTPRLERASTGQGFQKFPLLVRTGHRVTLELPQSTRRGAGLAYGPLPTGASTLRDAHRVVSFIACGRPRASASTADGRSVTFWSGGLVARSPRCVPLRVWVDRASRPKRVVIRLGVKHCG